MAKKNKEVKQEATQMTAPPVEVKAPVSKKEDKGVTLDLIRANAEGLIQLINEHANQVAAEGKNTLRFKAAVIDLERMLKSKLIA